MYEYISALGRDKLSECELRDLIADYCDTYLKMFRQLSLDSRDKSHFRLIFTEKEQNRYDIEGLFSAIYSIYPVGSILFEKHGTCIAYHTCRKEFRNDKLNGEFPTFPEDENKHDFGRGLYLWRDYSAATAHMPSGYDCFKIKFTGEYLEFTSSRIKQHLEPILFVPYAELQKCDLETELISSTEETQVF